MCPLHPKLIATRVASDALHILFTAVSETDFENICICCTRDIGYCDDHPVTNIRDLILWLDTESSYRLVTIDTCCNQL